MRWFCILTLVVVTISCSWADLARFTPPDPRLDKKVTLDVNNTKLEDVAKSLTEQTGITIKAGSGQRDWKVRETTVTIHAKDVTLGKALDNIGTLLGYDISREGKENEWSYIVWQDKKSRDLEAEMLTAEKEAAAKRVKEKLQGAMDVADKALKMTSDQAMKLKDKDPMTAYLGGTKSGRAWSQIMAMLRSRFPTEYDLMLRGKRALLPASSLPQEVLKDALTGGTVRTTTDQNGDKLTPYELVILPAGDDSSEAMMGAGGTLSITGVTDQSMPYSEELGRGNLMTDFPLISPGTSVSRIEGECNLALEAGEPKKEVEKRLLPKLDDRAFMSEALAKESPTEKEPPTDPELTREIEIEADGMPPLKDSLNYALREEPKTQNRILQEISRALGWEVYYESFNKARPLGAFIVPGKQPAFKVLIALEKAGYEWKHGDKSLRVRPDDWAIRRSYEIAGSFMAYYKDRIERNGELTLDDLANIVGSLTDEQFDHTFVVDPDFAFLNSSMVLAGEAKRDILRMYASLTSQQKEDLNGETGLAFDQLTDAQWDRLSTVISEKAGGAYLTGGSIRMGVLEDAGAQEPTAAVTGTIMLSTAKGRVFRVTMAVQDEQEPRTFDERLWIPDKEYLAAERAQRKQFEDAVKAAEEQKRKAQEASTAAK